MADDQGVPVRAARDRAISIVAAVLVAVGLVLTPVAVVAAQARPLLTDTDRFVATFGPLAGERAVQDAVADAAMAGIDSRVDFSALAATARNPDWIICAARCRRPLVGSSITAGPLPAAGA